MVKNKKKYATSDGWGYALFDAEGKTYPEEPKATQAACHACHTIVENRGYVFSEPFDFTSKVKFISSPPGRSRSPLFTTMARDKLIGKVIKVLPATSRLVRFVVNPELRREVFQGTLDELKPLLEAESLSSGLPAVFLSIDGKKFTAAIPVKRNECLNELGADLVSSGLGGSITTTKVCLHD